MSDKNISNRVIALLIVVALLVTIVSTWIVLLKIDSVQQTSRVQEGINTNSGSAKVAVSVLAPVRDKGVDTSAKAVINIVS